MVLHHRPAGDPLGQAVLRLSESSRTARTEPEPCRLVELPGLARGERRSAPAGAGHPTTARGGRISVGRARRARRPGNADRAAPRLVDLEHDVIDVAVHPALARLEGLDDRMVGGPVVFGGVLVLRRVTTADVAADLAQPQVHPGVAHLQTLLAPLRVGAGIPNQLEMRTDLRRGHGCSPSLVRRSLPTRRQARTAVDTVARRVLPARAGRRDAPAPPPRRGPSPG